MQVKRAWCAKSVSENSPGQGTGPAKDWNSIHILQAACLTISSIFLIFFLVKSTQIKSNQVKLSQIRCGWI